MDFDNLIILIIVISIALGSLYSCGLDEYRKSDPAHMHVCMEAKEKNIKLSGCE